MPVFPILMDAGPRPARASARVRMHVTMAEIIDYRSVFVASQSLVWLISQLFRLCFASEMQRPPGVFERGTERCLILAPTQGAAIVPMAVWMSEPRWPRRRYIIEVGSPVPIPDSLALEAGAHWLRQITLELHDRASRRGEHQR